MKINSKHKKIDLPENNDRNIKFEENSFVLTRHASSPKQRDNMKDKSLIGTTTPNNAKRNKNNRTLSLHISEGYGKNNDKASTNYLSTDNKQAKRNTHNEESSSKKIRTNSSTSFSMPINFENSKHFPATTKDSSIKVPNQLNKKLGNFLNFQQTSKITKSLMSSKSINNSNTNIFNKNNSINSSNKLKPNRNNTINNMSLNLNNSQNFGQLIQSNPNRSTSNQDCNIPSRIISSVKNAYSKPNKDKFQLRLNDYKEYCTDDQTESKCLTNEAKRKLDFIKESIIELLNSNRNKNFVIGEIENIYRSIVHNENSIDTKNETLVHMLKEENDLLRTKVELIDKRFERICEENTDLKQFLKDKNDGIEEMQSSIKFFHNELEKLKMTQSLNQSSGHNSSYANSNKNYSLQSGENRTKLNLLQSNILQVKVKENINKLKLPTKYRNSNNSNIETSNSLKAENTMSDEYKEQSLRNQSIKLNKNIFQSDDDCNCHTHNPNEKEKTACFHETIREVTDPNDECFNISLGMNDFNNCMSNNFNNIVSSNDSSTLPNSNTVQNNPNINFVNSNRDFNDEFLQNYEDFSPSWRREVDKMISRQVIRK